MVSYAIHGQLNTSWSVMHFMVSYVIMASFFKVKVIC